MKSFAVLAKVHWWLWLVLAALGLIGLLFVHSATLDRPEFQEQYGKQALFLLCSLGLSVFLLLPHYNHVLRAGWAIYGGSVISLLLLPYFAPTINGAQRWYAFPGFSVQPSEFAKPAVVIGLAALLRFKDKARTFDGLLLPIALVALPALLILKQPDLGSSLVLWPVLLAMCWTAGAKGRSLAIVCAIGLALAVLAYLFFLHGYQRGRIDAWLAHFTWAQKDLGDRDVLKALRGTAYQPWQGLIALGSGGWFGFGLMQGPQNRYDFLPYRSEDYVFAVVGEETGWFGCALVLLLHLMLALGILWIAMRTRERFGRLCCVGMAAWLGSQALLHAAVCAWMIPATGLPMPMISYGGSSTLCAVLGVTLCLNIGARREPVLAGDGFR